MSDTRVLVRKAIPSARVPRYATAGSVGCDLRAAILYDWTIEPQQRLAVPTGIAIDLPAGYEAQVRPRSGMALQHGITVLNAPGTIDADYRGEISVILINLGAAAHRILPGAKIAQLVIAPVTRVLFVQVEQLSKTDRGSGGFGSTDK